jgi:hypothetical protein
MWSSHRVARADAFLRQAESDLRTAQALSVRPLPLDPRDLPAQVLAKLAQAVEKSLKGVFPTTRTCAKDPPRARLCVCSCPLNRPP